MLERCCERPCKTLGCMLVVEWVGQGMLMLLCWWTGVVDSGVSVEFVVGPEEHVEWLGLWWTRDLQVQGDSVCWS